MSDLFPPIEKVTGHHPAARPGRSPTHTGPGSTEPAGRSGGGPTTALHHAEQLRERFWRLKAERVRANGPATTTRASSIGNSCERALFYERTVPADQRLKHEPWTQAIFDLGNALERYVVRELEDMGCEIVQRGRDYLDMELELSGHVDVSVRLPGWLRAVPAEIKGLNPFTAVSIETIDDIRNHRQAWVQKYYAQLQTYLYLSESNAGLFVLMNKSTGEITFIDCPRDAEFIDARVISRAEGIKRAVATRTAPERRVSSECARCQFATVCMPDRDFGPGVSVIDSEELEALLTRRSDLAKAHSEYVAVDKAAKALLPKKPGEILVGEKFVVTGKEKSRKAYSVGPATWVEFEIEKLGG